MEKHHLPVVVVFRSESRYLISSVSMWLPPFPGAQLTHQKVLALKGWDTLFAWARHVMVKSSEISGHHLRDIEKGAISGMNSRIMRSRLGYFPNNRGAVRDGGEHACACHPPYSG